MSNNSKAGKGLQREVFLRIMSKDGVDFSKEVIKQLREEKALDEAMEYGDKPDPEIMFRINKRGQIVDYKEMCTNIMTGKPQHGRYTKKEMQQIDSLMEKLDEGEWEGSILLDEDEYQRLSERVADYDFGFWGKGVRQFQNDIVDNTKKVSVSKTK